MVATAMAMSEIDNFIWKFKNLLHAGKKANLSINSEAGKALVTLTVEVNVPPFPSKSSRNGPSRQRRRIRRAAERAAAVIAAVEDAADQQSKVAEEVTDNVSNNLNATAEEVVQIPVEKAATAKEDFICELCDLSFKNTRGLRTHVGRVHKVADKAKNATEDNADIESSEEANPCDRCDFVGKTLAELNGHKTTKHLFGRVQRFSR